MVRVVFLLLGFSLILCASSAPSLKRGLLYNVVTLIRQLNSKSIGRFECVFLDLDPGPHLFDGWLSSLLAKSELKHVVRYVLNSHFKLTDENLPNKPGLVIVHVGRWKLNYVTKHGTDFFSALDCNSRLLVLVDTYKRDNFRGIITVLSSLKYDKVVYYIDEEQVALQLDFQGNFLGEARRILDLPNLFQSNIRNSRGRPIRIFFRHSEWPSTALWVQETARFLNTNVLYVPNVCTENMAPVTCISRLFYAYNVDISLDRIGSNGYSTQLHHVLFDFQPTSMVILVPQSRPFNAVEIFTKPFTVESWIVLMSILLLVELINLMFPYLFKNDPILLLVCGFERYNLHHTNTKEKFSLFPLMVFFFLMFNAYETKIISFMTNKPSIEPIRTAQHLINSGIKIKADIQNYPDLLNDSTLGHLFVQKEMGGRLDEIHAYLLDSFSAPNVLSVKSSYDFKLDRPKYVRINENWFGTITMFWIGMKSPLAEMFAYTQKVFFESGLYMKWEDDFRYEDIKEDKAYFAESVSEDSVWLTFEDLESTWAVLAIGLGVSIVVFVFELVQYFCKKKCC